MAEDAWYYGSVADGTYFADAVDWTSANGIVSGYGNDSFGPDNSITREQMATILYRYATYKKYDTMQGSNNKLLPQGAAARAQVQQFSCVSVK